jgi:hypothetical protein
MLSASLIETQFMTTKLLRLCAATVFLTTATLLHAAIAPAENLLPADTLAFFTVPNYAAFRASSQDAPLSRLWNDPAMKPFHDKFMAKWNETYIAPLEKDLGLKVADFLALPQGQLTFAVTVNGSNGHDDTPPGLLLLLDAKDKSSALKTNLAALTKKWTDAGRKLRTETIHGLAFTVVPLSSNDFAGILPKKTPVSEIGKEPKPVKPGEMYFAQYQSLLVAGNTASVVETVAAHLTGGSVPAIADDAIFAGDKLSQFRDAPTGYGWFNGNKFINLLTANDAGSADDSQPAMMPKFTATKIIGAIGLGGLKSASIAVRQQPEGLNVAMHITAPEASRAGLLKMLALSQKDASIPAFVPADAVKVSRFRLDGKQTWAELQKMVAAISPQYVTYLNSAIDMVNTLAQAKDPSFDLRTALFGNLGDDLIIYGKSPAGDSLAEMLNAPALYLVAVANPDQVINAVKNLVGLSAPQDSAPAPRDFLGHKIYSLAQRSQSQPDGTPAAPSYVYLSASGGYLAISKNSGILEEFLRSADGKLKPLNATAGLAELASHVGGTGGGLFTYENQRESMRTSFKFLKGAGGSATLRLFPPTFRDWADFALLPDYDAVAKYFYRSVAGGNANADGLTLKIFTPRPPQLN